MHWAKMRSVVLVLGALFLCSKSKELHAQMPSSAYDGQYVGIQSFVVEKSSSSSCTTHSFPRTLIIKNENFIFLFNAGWNWIIKGTVAADGTVSGFGTSSAGGQALKGKIQGALLTGTTFNVGCYYALELIKR